MSQELIDLTVDIKNNILEDFLFPDTIATSEAIFDEGEIQENFECGWARWGSDTEGGFAYVGLKADIDLVEKQVINYLKQGTCNDNQYYARWDLVNGFSLLMLYDSYLSNIYQEHVLCVSFGSWINDEELLHVLETKLYIGDEVHWSVAGRLFSEDDPEHLLLLQKMKQSIQCIDDKEYYTILKEKALLEQHVLAQHENQHGLKL